MNSFDVKTIALSGKNLIEASAGTGKTYSVSIMALRMILEMDISVSQILMVTFTEAAAAEMAERFRKFIRIAYEKSKGTRIADEMIDSLVQNCEAHRSKLRKAYLQIDDINVFTIHGFCNKTLREYAFEAGRLFEFEIISDNKNIFQEVFNNYWREELIIGQKQHLGYKTHNEILHNLLFNQKLSQTLINVYDTEKAYFDELKSVLESKITAYKFQNNYLTYDDLIQHLHDAAEDRNKAKNLSRVLQEKYKAVFIDEFQDTDVKQFSIFSNLFQDTVQFYIGDPKQCIYSFRGADLNAYLKVKEIEGVNEFNMETNFRSTPEMVGAVNDFYGAQNDPFKNKDIKYNPVKAFKKSIFISDGQMELNALSIYFAPFQQQIVDSFVVNRVLYYLNECKFSDGRRVKPENIAILFRTNSQIERVRQALIDKGVPALKIDDSSIFKSDETDFIIKVIKLLLTPTKENLIQLLLSQYNSFSAEEIAAIDISEELLKIKVIKANLNKKGIYHSLHELIELYHKEEQIKFEFGLNYNRMKSNVLQLIDILHSKVTEEKVSFELLERFLIREKALETDESGNYEQKLESEENAVKLMTIHKSKGLEFGITILPSYKTSFNDDENFRVLYVALTRAKYKTDLICLENGTYSHKQLIDLLKELQKNKKIPQHFESYQFSSQDPDDYKELKNEEIYKTPNLQFINKNWKISSYSALATHTDFIPINEYVDTKADYDKFVFDEMPRGTAAGIFLHNLFENADFSTTDMISYVNDFKSHYLIKKGAASNTEKYAALLKNVLKAKYAGFDLTDIKNEQRLNEFGYHLKIQDNTKVKAISNFLNKDSDFGEAEISGMLMGFIDMIFEHNGKYYILDWKSNYLGNTLNAYDRDNMGTAIKANSYDLQYYIYSVALCRFLKQRIVDFDYDKHFGGGFWVFLRGCRTGKESGIYHFQPDQDVYLKLNSLFS